MTEEELYNIIINDDDAVKCLEDNNYKRLYKYILNKYQDIEVYELTNMLINAGIDVFSDGEILPMAFAGDKSLTNFDFSKINKIGKLAFRNTGITSANLKTVKEIDDGAFFGSNLSEVYLGSVKINSAAFARTKLTELYIPDNTIIEEDAFGGCNELETVVLDGTNIALKNDSFDYCRNINNIFISSEALNFAIALLKDCNFNSNVTVNIMPTSKFPYDEEYIRDFLARHFDISKIELREVD